MFFYRANIPTECNHPEKRLRKLSKLIIIKSPVPIQSFRIFANNLISGLSFFKSEIPYIL